MARTRPPTFDEAILRLENERKALEDFQKAKESLGEFSNVTLTDEEDQMLESIEKDMYAEIRYLEIYLLKLNNQK